MKEWADEHGLLLTDDPESGSGREEKEKVGPPPCAKSVYILARKQPGQHTHKSTTQALTLQHEQVPRLVVVCQLAVHLLA